MIFSLIFKNKFFFKITFLGIILCKKSITRIENPQKRFLDLVCPKKLEKTEKIAKLRSLNEFRGQASFFNDCN